MFCRHPSRAMSLGMLVAVPAAARCRGGSGWLRGPCVQALGTPSVDQEQRGEAPQLRYLASAVTAFPNQSTSSSELGISCKKSKWLVKKTLISESKVLIIHTKK